MEDKVTPQKFVDSWLKDIPTYLPQPSEVEYARFAIKAHAVFLYDNPLLHGADTRDRNASVRRSLNTYADLLWENGTIATILKFKKAADDFLRAFSRDPDGELIYKVPESVLATPMRESALRIRLSPERFLDMGVVTYILSWLLFLGKAPFDRPDLEYSAEIAWAHRQFFPKPIRATENDFSVVRKIVSWLVDDYQPSLGNHGPGSTNVGAKTVEEKNENFIPTIQTLELTSFGVDHNPLKAYKPVRSKPPDSVVRFVKKDVGSLRAITMEDPAVMHGQQALKREWYFHTDFICETPLSRFITFSDQTPTRRIALASSAREGLASTIDSKSASDRISVDLILRTFPASLVHYLACARSWNSVSSTGDVVELSMYGGMGSAVTFPVQSTIFAAIAIYAVLLWLSNKEGKTTLELDDYLTPDGFRRRYRWAEKLIRVYGDDLTVPDASARLVLEYLDKFGLEVNEAKSFMEGSPVREACGIYALAGRDITPLRFRVPSWSNGALADTAEFDGARELANESYRRGYKHLYGVICNHLQTRKYLLSGSEKRKKSTYSKALDTKLRLEKPQLLFEDASVTRIPIGILSSRKTATSVVGIAHGGFKIAGITSLQPKTETENYSNGEYYYYLQELYNMRLRQEAGFDPDHVTVDHFDFEKIHRLIKVEEPHQHGKIARGVRFKKRNVVLKSAFHWTSLTTEWGWAPA